MGTKTKVGIGVGVVVLIVAALLTTNTGIFKGAMLGGGALTYNGAKYGCQDGTSGTLGGPQAACRLSAAWSAEAKLACTNKCSPKTGKCGLNSFYAGAACARAQPVVVVAGALTGIQEGSPDSSIGVAGSSGVVMSRYKFSAANEAFTITKLNVVGTTTNATAFNGTPSLFTGGNNIIRVGLSYPKKDGTTETVYANMSSGKASFTNLNFYVAKDQSAAITILADLNTIDFGATSGASFRLGLNELTTIATNSFEAVGEGSSEKKDATTVNAMAGSTGVNPVVLRKTVPTVAKLASASTKLNSGQNDIAAITIAADRHEAVALKRFAFTFDSTALTINNLEVYRKIGGGAEFSITNNLSISNSAGADLKAGGIPLVNGANTHDVILVKWNDEEVVSRGITNTYIIRANVAGAQRGSSLNTYIADDVPSNDLDINVRAETADNLCRSLNNRNFIWSDNSAVNHSVLTRDWTNGKDVISLPTQTQSLTF